MRFLWPELLWTLLALPLLVLFYIAILRRRKKMAMQYAGLATVKAAMSQGQRLRQHLPPLLFLLAFAGMLLAVARPVAVVTLPSQYKTMILAIDVSGSMRANDVKPTRFDAAISAVKAFVNQQPGDTRVGLVSFAGTASMIQLPTTNREDLLDAVSRLQLQYGTAVGSGILVSLKAIFPDAEFDLTSADPGRISSRDQRSSSLDSRAGREKPARDFKPVAPGSYANAAIILLTDGHTTTGPEPVKTAQLAAERGVKVYTIGLGTVEGQIVTADGWSMHTSLDEDALKEISSVTKGEYFYAGTAEDLNRIYKSLNSRIAIERKETETTALFAAVAACLALLSALLSLLWFNRVL
ncbi:VWA domain-containing protein [Noviherbaspirillum galbum]|uniref:VWA domain-containing protein n=1 Tax=Noviherbaspirillum galbum TaxID=2709383 RepID=A0A6B3SWX5_9BURK|nr:VWA domain-containing protein [Noviherbaspirillum galbum]NEX63526.1 VWA domain-containing protein [Noviherbaspirillum galbum]